MNAGESAEYVSVNTSVDPVGDCCMVRATGARSPFARVMDSGEVAGNGATVRSGVALLMATLVPRFNSSINVASFEWVQMRVEVPWLLVVTF